MSMRWLVPIAAASPRRLRSAAPCRPRCSIVAARSRSRDEAGPGDGACPLVPGFCTIWDMYQMVQRTRSFRAAPDREMTDERERWVMRRRHIDLTTTTPAPRTTVYRLLADGSTWPRWAAIDGARARTPR